MKIPFQNHDATQSTAPSTRRAGPLALFGAAALALPLLTAAPSAQAGDCRSSGSSWSITVGSHGTSTHYRSHHRSSRYHHSDYGHRSGGYYKQVWVPPVYRTHYDDCGRAYQVCVRRGYYKSVYVRSSYRSSHYDYDRRGQWGNSSGCRRY
ncbi:hypothetical protein [Algisphaera agarilytica]|uniref:Lectin-like protein BA14k n=1 Tax=Algisphaera agarilytica TaxID=1385975 RepID=A0A7X0H9U2_9BACT|nr:hypothetical protein [Algisphaera agarilytica]MBB6430419.1 hypothetical protein [Algisphaera agarilytica]